jgi:DNA-binding MarR family transcriptional regulator
MSTMVANSANAMRAGSAGSARPARPARLGGALGRAWVGYQRRLDAEMAAAGFRRALPDGRVLRVCARSTEPTISQIGRELGITRQGASKLVAGLRDRQFVTLSPSPSDRREKIVQLSPRAVEYLAAQRRAARKIERQLQAELGPTVLESLYRLLEALGGAEQPRLSDYLRKAVNKNLLVSIDEPRPRSVRPRGHLVKPAGSARRAG